MSSPAIAVTRIREFAFSLVTFALVSAPASAAARECDVRTFGATGRKQEDATPALQKAIDTCAAAGGGRVYLGAGSYTSGPLTLKSGVRLHLEAGATLLASRDPAVWARPRAEAGRRHNVLLWGDSVRDVVIEGDGVIDGQAAHEWGPPRGVDPLVQPYEAAARALGEPMERPKKIEPVVSLVALVNARHVAIRDVTMRRSATWTLHLCGSQDVRIRGVRIESSRTQGANADGIDIDGSRDVHVSDTAVDTGDDAIVIKTTDRCGPARAVENVVVTNCVLSSTSAAFKVGTETRGDVRRVVFGNSVIRDSNRGVAIMLRDGATVSDLVVSNLTIETRRHAWFWWGNGEPFHFVVDRRSPTSPAGQIRDLLVTNVIATGQGTSVVQGLPERRLDGITFERVKLRLAHDPKRDPRGQHGLAIAHADGVSLRDVEVTWVGPVAAEWQSALAIEQAREVVIDGFKGRPAAANAPAVLLRNVEGADVHRGRAAPGTDVFLSVSGPDTRRVRVRDSDFGPAKVGVRVDREVPPGAIDRPSRAR